MKKEEDKKEEEIEVFDGITEADLERMEECFDNIIKNYQEAIKRKKQ